MKMRTYQPGDEQAQAAIFNNAAGGLPAFKPATAEEIARRYRSEADPEARFYAVDGDRVVAYAVCNPNGRISYPWCLPGSESAREPLLEAVLAALRKRGCREAWVAYRADWLPVLAFLKERGFAHARDMINYVAELKRLPLTPVPEGQTIAPLARADVLQATKLGKDIFQAGDPKPLEKFFFANSYLDPAHMYTLKVRGGQTLGLGLAIINVRYADPTKLDAAMPCFRLGTLGTESERHKRVNGMFSCLFTSESAGETLLAEAARRFAGAGLSHAATQAASDQTGLCRFYDRYFQRQGTFPILVRQLARPGG